jgi:hypothetical protein
LLEVCASFSRFDLRVAQQMLRLILINDPFAALIPFDIQRT